MDNLQTKRKILFVDDMRQNIDVLRDIFSDYVRMVALNGEHALKIAASRNPPDLILLDIMMPDIDGFEVCRRLKADEQTKHIPVIFVTAKKEASDEALGLSLGAVDYIIKPFNVDVIRQRVKVHLAQKDLLDGLKEQIQQLNARLFSLNPVCSAPS
ncbi:MAG: response regulator [Magnetococcales bacterium]|nr:response regulator [Magnetococcales bacterium]MBF0438246.1 response regulator [Magnetococcales bacterium]